MTRYEVTYTVNEGSPYQFESSDGPYVSVKDANERIKELKRIPHISNVHRRAVDRMESLS